MNTMRTKKMYNANDFQNVRVEELVSTSWWTIDSADFTRIGEFSRVPLFLVELKQLRQKGAGVVVPDGYEDDSASLQPTRMYYVREGRPLYNELARIYRAVEGNKDDFMAIVAKQYAKKVYSGYVAQLSGVNYTKRAKNGLVVQKTGMRQWMPEGAEMSSIFDDFLYLCNKGSYTPIIDEPKQEDPLAGLDRATIEKLLAMLNK